MSRNGSGTYILPTGNPVVTGTVIQSSTFNSTLTDVANEMTNSLPRDGQAPMTAPLKVVDGTSTIPGLAFNSESSSGLFRPSTGNVALTVSGVEALRANSGGRVLVGTTTDDGTTRLQVNGNASVSGNETVGGTLGVTGNTTVGGSISVTAASAITGGLNGTPIGATTPSTGAFTTLSTTGAFTSTGAITLPNAVAIDWKDTGSVARRGSLLSGSNFYFGDIDNGISGSSTLVRANNSIEFDINAAAVMSLTSGQINLSKPLLIAPGSGEALRLENDSAYLSFYNSLNTTRSGFLQIATGGAVTLSNDQAQPLILQTNAAQRLYITGTGATGFNMVPTTQYDFAVGGGMLRVGSGGGNNIIQAYSSGGTLGLWAGGGSQIYSNSALSFLVGATTGTSNPTGGTTAISINSAGAVTMGGSIAMGGNALTSAATEAVRIQNDAGYFSGWNTANSTRTGYLQFNTGSSVALVAENGSALQLGTNSTIRAYLDTSGNLGVGISPVASLSGITSKIMATGSGATGVVAYDNGTANNQRIGMFADSTANLVGFDNNYSSTTNGMVWRINAAEKMRLDTNGNVLVGTNAASFNAAGRGLVEINGSSTALLGFKIGGTSNGYLYHDGTNLTLNNLNSSGALAFYTNNTSRMSISSGGATTFNGAVTMNASLLASTAAEAFRVENDGGFISFYNTANTARNGYLQGGTGAGLTLQADLGYLALSSASGAVNIQTASTNRLTISNSGTIADGAGNELGWKDVPANSQTSAYTLVIGDRGKQVLITTGGVTVPQSVFSVGNVVTIVNNSGTAQTITQGTGVTLHQAGTTNTGNRTLAAWGIATVLCIGSSVFIISGNVS